MVVGAAIVAVVGVGELVAAGLGASIVFLLTLLNVVFNLMARITCFYELRNVYNISI